MDIFTSAKCCTLGFTLGSFSLFASLLLLYLETFSGKHSDGCNGFEYNIKHYEVLLKEFTDPSTPCAAYNTSSSRETYE